MVLKSAAILKQKFLSHLLLMVVKRLGKQGFFYIFNQFFAPFFFAKVLGQL
jgi:hypothetical protein